MTGLEQDKKSKPLICKAESHHAIVCLKTVEPSLRSTVDHLHVDLLLPDLLVVLHVEDLYVIGLPPIVLGEAGGTCHPLNPHLVVLTLKWKIILIQSLEFLSLYC